METQSISTYEVIDSLLLQVQNMATESVIMSSDFSKLILETHKHSEVWQRIKKLFTSFPKKKEVIDKLNKIYIYTGISTIAAMLFFILVCKKLFKKCNNNISV